MHSESLHRYDSWQKAQRPARQSGVVLINVLAIIAVASSVAYMMITLQGTAIHRSQRFSEAAQAAAYARGGETSAIVALRRDGREAPQSDHYGEPWAALAERDAPIGNGTFSLTIEDAQSRFNVNTLERGGILALRTLEKIVTALELPVEVAQRIAERVLTTGPLESLGALRDGTLNAAVVARLSPLVTALPDDSTKVNINTASEGLIAILLDNPVAARVLISRRERRGYLTDEDIKRTGVLLPPGVGTTSSFFRVTVAVRIGETQQQLSSLLARRQVDGRPDVVAIARQRGRATPL